MTVTATSETFDWRRLGLLLRNDIVGGYRRFLLHAGVIAGVVIAIQVINDVFGGEPPNDAAQFWWFYAFLYGWGCVIASSAFGELHDRTRNDAYLLLPASALEKTASRFVLATLGFYAFFLVFSAVLGLVVQTLHGVFRGGDIRWFPRPGEGLQWVLFGHLLVVQSLFFLGAAWFRKSHFFKTLMTIVIGGWGVIAFAFIVAFLMLPMLRDGWGLSFNDYDLYPVYEAYPTVVAVGYWILKVAYFAGLPLLCAFVAWLRVRETQVSHGV
jgi:hypothetical protein